MSYFEARNVKPGDPMAAELPPWFDEALPASRTARILDIGCGHGGFLFALKRRGYANVEGIEFDAEAADYCRAHGLKVRRADIMKIDLAKAGPFDLVMMTHVLEHLPKDRMIEIVGNIRSALAANGALYVAVPNAQSNTGAYWAFEDFTHTFLFTSGSLYYVARMAGFEQIRFLDPDCTAGASPLVRLARRALLAVYRANKRFWNKVTRSSYHNESPAIFSYEIKALLTN